MASDSEELKELLEIRTLLNEAIKSQRRSDKCTANYVSRTNSIGFSRASTTSFNANASNNISALKSDKKSLKDAVIALFNIETT